MKPVLCIFLVCALVMGGPAVAASCADTAGQSQARHYIEQCRAVSPTGRWSCSPARSCVMIRDETRRGCTLLGPAAPAFCKYNS